MKPVYKKWAFFFLKNKNKLRNYLGRILLNFLIYIRCDYLVVTHCIIIYDIGRFSTLKNLDFRRLKITRDGRTDGPTDGPTDRRTDGHDLL